MVNAYAHFHCNFEISKNKLIYDSQNLAWMDNPVQRQNI